MSGAPEWQDSDELPADLARLRNAIACELHAQLTMRNEIIRLEDVPGVSYAVAANLRHAFRIEWAPSWEADREDDESLGLDGATFRGSHLGNEDSPGQRATRYPIFDQAWPRRTD